MNDLGISNKRLRVKTDASVAKSLASRRGLGGIRHIEVNQLWLQERVNNSELEIEKVKGEINRADVLTKYKDGESIKRQLNWTNQVITSGRHSIAPKMSAKDPLEDMDNGGSDNGEEQLNNVISHKVISDTTSERGRAHGRPWPGQGQSSLNNCLSNNLLGSWPMCSSAMALNKSQGGGGVLRIKHRNLDLGHRHDICLGYGSRPSYCASRFKTSHGCT